jgi:hypothetical protein
MKPGFDVHAGMGINNVRVTIVTGNRTFRRRATIGLAADGAIVRHCGLDPKQIGRDKRKSDIYVVDADSDGEQVQALLKAIHRADRTAVTLLASRELEGPLMAELLTTHRLNNFIGVHDDKRAGDGVFDVDELIITCRKLANGDIFGIEKYLPPWEPEVVYHQVWDKDDKRLAMEALDEFLRHIDCHLGIQPLILTVADELLMNAIYNAPRDPWGQPKYQAIERRQPLLLEAHECVEMRFGCSGRYVVLSVADSFGSLNRRVLTHYLTRGMRGKVEVEQKEGGPGLGLHVVLNSTTQLVFNVEENVRTEVIALFYVRGGTREFKEAGRSLGIFMV